MGAAIGWAEVEVGDELDPLTFSLRRADLVRYAGASGDFNPIHWDEHIAAEVGLPDVIAHGMLTMGRAIGIVEGWTGDPGSVREYGVKFPRPVVVPHEGGATVTVTGRVAAKLDDQRVRVDLTASSDGVRVLGVARAVVQLA